MGYTKHEYENYIIEIRKELTQYIGKASVALPGDYDFSDILAVIQKYYPYEWRILQERYQEYTKADIKLQRLGKKARYGMERPEQIVQSLKIVKGLLAPEQISRYNTYRETEAYREKLKEFIEERNTKVSKRKEKIDKALEKTQQVEPEFIDQLMGLYDRKNTSQKDKVYILVELEKYYCPKLIAFFKKIAHSEINFQLREEAVRHLLSFGHYAKLRKQKYMQIHVNNTKRKKQIRDIYAKERFNIDAIPSELEYRIANSREQKLKCYDYFISHSSGDYELVQNLIYYLNKNGKNIYCDWINDSDYLKRNLVCDATLEVIKKRLVQSKNIILVLSEKSCKSPWVKYELNFSAEQDKPIYSIKTSEIKKGKYEISLLDDYWFIDKDYKNIKLYSTEGDN